MKELASSVKQILTTQYPVRERNIQIISGMALGEHDLRVVPIHEVEDVPTACYVEILTISRAIALDLEYIAGCRDVV